MRNARLWLGLTAIALTPLLGCASLGAVVLESANDQCSQHNHVISCRTLGDEYLHADGISNMSEWSQSVDKPKAKRAYTRACDLGDGTSCARLVEMHLVDTDPALRETLTARAIELGVTPRSDEEVTKWLADQRATGKAAERSLKESRDKAGSGFSLGDVLGAVSTAAGSQAGVDPKTAATLKKTAEVTKTASDVAHVVEAVADRNQTISAGTASSRAVACANATAAVSANGPCSGSPSKREIGECTCATTGSGATTVYACHVETKFACATPAREPAVASSTRGDATPSAGPAATAAPAGPVVVAAAVPAPAPTMTPGEATSALSPSAANLPGALSDAACDANTTCKSLQQQCNDKNAGGCASLASGYEHGLFGVAKNPAKAAALNAAACDADAKGAGCIALANMYFQGLGVPKSKERALALSKRSCGAGLAPGCSMTSNFGDADYGTTKLRSLCDGDDWMACTYLSGVASEKPHALERLHAMCDGGNATACSALKNIH